MMYSDDKYPGYVRVMLEPPPSYLVMLAGTRYNLFA